MRRQMRKMRFAGGRFVAFGILWAGVMGAVVYVLWNWLMPGIFGLSHISYLHALGLLALARVLFGRFGGHGRGGRRGRCVRGMGDLTPEERERFRAAMGPAVRE